MDDLSTSEGWVDERRLRYRSPLDAEHLLGFLGSRAIPGVEAVHDGRYTRTMRAPAGAPIVLELELDRNEASFVLRATGSGAFGSVAPVITGVRKPPTRPRTAIGAPCRSDSTTAPTVTAAIAMKPAAGESK